MMNAGKEGAAISNNNNSSEDRRNTSSRDNLRSVGDINWTQQQTSLHQLQQLKAKMVSKNSDVDTPMKYNRLTLINGIEKKHRKNCDGRNNRNISNERDPMMNISINTNMSTLKDSDKNRIVGGKEAPEVVRKCLTTLASFLSTGLSQTNDGNTVTQDPIVTLEEIERMFFTKESRSEQKLALTEADEGLPSFCCSVPSLELKEGNEKFWSNTDEIASSFSPPITVSSTSELKTLPMTLLNNICKSFISLLSIQLQLSSDALAKSGVRLRHCSQAQESDGCVNEKEDEHQLESDKTDAHSHLVQRLLLPSSSPISTTSVTTKLRNPGPPLNGTDAHYVMPVVLDVVADLNILGTSVLGITIVETPGAMIGYFSANDNSLQHESASTTLKNVELFLDTQVFLQCMNRTVKETVRKAVQLSTQIVLNHHHNNNDDGNMFGSNHQYNLLSMPNPSISDNNCSFLRYMQIQHQQHQQYHQYQHQHQHQHQNQQQRHMQALLLSNTYGAVHQQYGSGGSRSYKENNNSRGKNDSDNDKNNKDNNKDINKDNNKDNNKDGNKDNNKDSEKDNNKGNGEDNSKDNGKDQDQVEDKDKDKNKNDKNKNKNKMEEEFEDKVKNKHVGTQITSSRVECNDNAGIPLPLSNKNNDINIERMKVAEHQQSIVMKDRLLLYDPPYFVNSGLLEQLLVQNTYVCDNRSRSSNLWSADALLRLKRKLIGTTAFNDSNDQLGSWSRGHGSGIRYKIASQLGRHSGTVNSMDDNYRLQRTLQQLLVQHDQLIALPRKSQHLIQEKNDASSSNRNSAKLLSASSLLFKSSSAKNKGSKKRELKTNTEETCHTSVIDDGVDNGHDDSRAIIAPAKKRKCQRSNQIYININDHNFLPVQSIINKEKGDDKEIEKDNSISSKTIDGKTINVEGPLQPNTEFQDFPFSNSVETSNDETKPEATKTKLKTGQTSVAETEHESGSISCNSDTDTNNALQREKNSDDDDDNDGHSENSTAYDEFNYISIV